MALQQIQTQNPDFTLEVVCIHGGPITQVSKEEMASILQGTGGLREKKAPLLYAQRNVSYHEFVNKTLEAHSRESLFGGHPGQVKDSNLKEIQIYLTVNYCVTWVC